MPRTRFRTLGAALALLFAAPGHAQNKTTAQLEAMFQKRTFASTSPALTMAYRLYVPADYNPAQKYPVVVALHGVGERGNDNSIQLTREELAQPWVRDSVQAKHPHFVMIPQCPATNNQYWWPWNNWPGTWNGTWSGTRSDANAGIVGILDSLKREFSLDTTRFYVAGLSMGGFGVLELMKWAPTLFAAGVPAAAGGDTSPAALSNYTKTPFWAFHSATDPTVNVDRGARAYTRLVEARIGPIVRFVSDTGLKNPTAISVDSLRKAVYVTGANFLYSEVRNAPGTGNALHQAGWLAAFRHPMLTDWVFSKQKVNGVTVSVMPASRSAAFPAARPSLVLHNGSLRILRAEPQGSTAFYTLEGKRLVE